MLVDLPWSIDCRRLLTQIEDLRERDVRLQLDALVAARQLVGNAIFSLEVSSVLGLKS